MKIAVLGTRGFPDVQGGIETHCENLYPAIVNQEDEVVVFTRRPYVNPKVKSYKGVRLISLPCLKNKFIEAFLHTFLGVFAAKTIRPDIVHIHGIGPALFIPLIRLLGLKTVVTNHGPDYQRNKWGRLAKIILRMGEYFSNKWADEVICISDFIAAGVRKKYKRQSTVIPNGIIISGGSFGKSMRQKYGLIKGKYILSVGRFVPEKGFHDLIVAFTNNSKFTERGWKLVIVGGENHKDKYGRDLKEQAHRNNKVILTGFLTRGPLQELYSHAGIFVLPSYYEGFPIVLLEALSYGLPCIASDIAGVREIGLPRNSFFNPGNVQQLTKKIEEFIEQPLAGKEWKEQTKTIIKKYNWSLIAEQTKEVYRRLIN